MKIVFLKITSAKSDWSNLAVEEYNEKLKHFSQFEIVELKPEKNSRQQAEQKIQSESKKILSFLKPDDFFVLFDENGKTFDSIQFSKQIENMLGSSKKRLVFLIGGAFGVSEDVKSRAQIQISFSKMVMNHLVAQVVALEQIYRSFTIIKNIPYHNE